MFYSAPLNLHQENVSSFLNMCHGFKVSHYQNRITREIPTNCSLLHSTPLLIYNLQPSLAKRYCLSGTTLQWDVGCGSVGGGIAAREETEICAIRRPESRTPEISVNECRVALPPCSLLRTNRRWRRPGGSALSSLAPKAPSITLADMQSLNS